MARIKKSTLAGRWYASDPLRLRDEVAALLRHARRPTVNRLGGLVVPHAGYMYSGAAAATGYAAIEGVAYRRVVILAPSHFRRFRGAAVLDVDGFETPLGLVTVDTDAVAALRNQPLFREDMAPYQQEHSLEIQLPFLQHVLPAAAVVPVLLSDLSAADCTAVAGVLSGWADSDTLFLASSDFVHYGASFGYMPFAADGLESVRDALRRLDMGAIERVCAGDAAGFRRYVEETGATICGRMPIEALLDLVGPYVPGELLSYYTSLDVTGDYEHSVSYASIAFPRRDTTTPDA